MATSVLDIAPGAQLDLLSPPDRAHPHLVDPTGAPLELDAAHRDALELRVRAVPAHYEPAKRSFDILAAIVLALVTSPVILLALAAVKLSSPGPVIFRQTRVGRGSRTFTCYKFRTMTADAEQRITDDHQLRETFVHSWKIDGDPRITRVGKLLRKLSIDELPQLWNVLRGEMSLVGPRPVQPAELEQHYGEMAPVVFCVPPGITGLWQVSGRSSVTYAERVQIDLDYVRRRGMLFDVRIVLRTLPVVLFGRHAK